MLEPLRSIDPPREGCHGGSHPGGKGLSGREDREVIIEFLRVGNSVKVTAVDPDTLVEVSIVGPPGAGEEALSRTAIKKLAYVLERRARLPRDKRPR